MSTNSGRDVASTSSMAGNAPASGTVERWFLVLVSALVPLLGALFLPASWRTVLHVLGGALCASGVILLVRHELAERRKRSHVTDR